MVSTTPGGLLEIEIAAGNTGNLEFEIAPRNTGNLQEFS